MNEFESWIVVVNEGDEIESSVGGKLYIDEETLKFEIYFLKGVSLMNSLSALLYELKQERVQEVIFSVKDTHSDILDALDDNGFEYINDYHAFGRIL